MFISLAFITLALSLPSSQWMKVYGGNNNEFVYGISANENNIAFIVKEVSSTQLYYTFFIDYNGDSLWVKNCTTSVAYFKMKKAHDNNLLIYFSCGDSINSGIGLLKIDTSGNKIWIQEYYIPTLNIPHKLEDFVQISDGSYFLFCNLFLVNQTTMIIKANSTGNYLWYDLLYLPDGELFSAEQSYNNGAVLTGVTENGFANVHFVEIDNSGNILCDKNYGGDLQEYGKSICRTPDSCYMILAETRSFGSGMNDLWILKLNQNGDTLWTKVYGGSDYEFACEIIPVEESCFAAVARTRSFGSGDYDIWILKIDKNGDTLWTRTVGGDSTEIPKAIALCPDGDYLVSGNTISYGIGDWDLIVAKIDKDGNVSVLEEENNEHDLLPESNPIVTYINCNQNTVVFDVILPSTGSLRIGIYDLTGRLVNNVCTGFYNSGSYRFHSHIESTGQYFLRIDTDSSFYSEKFTVI